MSILFHCKCYSWNLCKTMNCKPSASHSHALGRSTQSAPVLRIHACMFQKQAKEYDECGTIVAKSTLDGQDSQSPFCSQPKVARLIWIQIIKLGLIPPLVLLRPASVLRHPTAASWELRDICSFRTCGRMSQYDRLLFSETGIDTPGLESKQKYRDGLGWHMAIK